MDWFQVLAAVVAVAIGLGIIAAVAGGIVAVIVYRRVSKTMSKLDAERRLTYGERLRRKYDL